VRLEMPESLADKVHAGSRVTTSSLNDGKAIGTVIKLYPSIQAGQVSADVDMPGIDNRLIGRRVSAKVEVGTRKALLVPTSYVTNRFGIDYVSVLAMAPPLASLSRLPRRLSPARLRFSPVPMSGTH